MPSKVASETPFSLPRLIGYWLASVVLAYALGWAHLSPSDAGADPAPPGPPAPAAPAPH